MRRFSVSTRIGSGVAAVIAVFAMTAAAWAPSASSAAKDVSNRVQAAKLAPGTGVQHVITVTGVRMPALPERYTVLSGDTLSGIAAKTDGNPACWPGIYRANSGQIQDPDMIYAGQRLEIPGYCDLRPVEQAAIPAVVQRVVHHVQPSGTPQEIAQEMLGSYGWGSGQMDCLIPLWNAESGWNVYAQNPSSGAYGIPQALPGYKMASAGADWASDAATQIRWGLGYIASVYGTPCGAWAQEQAYGWY